MVLGSEIDALVKMLSDALDRLERFDGRAAGDDSHLPDYPDIIPVMGRYDGAPGGGAALAANGWIDVRAGDVFVVTVCQRTDSWNVATADLPLADLLSRKNVDDHQKTAVIRLCREVIAELAPERSDGDVP